MEEDDKNKPTLSDIHFNINDTIVYYTKDGVRKTIRLNDSLYLEAGRTDTIPVGKWLYISAHFADDVALSTFTVRGKVVYKSTKTNVKDSIMEFVRPGRNIFGEKEKYVFRNRLIQIQDTLRASINNTMTNFFIDTDRPIDLFVVCMDKAGNKDSVQVPVRMLRRSEIISALGNK